jgi:hypothetical protein
MKAPVRVTKLRKVEPKKLGRLLQTEDVYGEEVSLYSRRGDFEITLVFGKDKPEGYTIKGDDYIAALFNARYREKRLKRRKEHGNIR